MKYHHLTNDEIIKQVSLRDDLTDLEHDLLDRLISCDAEVTRLQRTCFCRTVDAAEPVQGEISG